MNTYHGPMDGWQGIGRMLVVAGVALTLAGALLWAGGRLGIGSLPGDIRLGSDKWGCYLPIATSLLLSLVLTIVLNLLIRWFGK